ncbi:hypothetical protein ACIQV3_35830 [Streptomyces sp. NPDC099050]|uniref:hypothetical protein n=1 Tax=Streptomyces sp. NPDC099050 TaxID=3366100 RepID=UPI0038283A3E
MIRLITAARLRRLTQAADYAELRVRGALKDAGGAARLAEKAVADTERVEDAYRRLCQDNVAQRETATSRAADVRIAAFDIVAALIDDRLTDEERREQLARHLVARRELLGLDTMPAPIWRHVADIARRENEVDEDLVEVTGSTGAGEVAPATSTTPSH